MQTTDPRRTPRPDSEERTPKQGAAARPLPVNRRAPQRRGPNQSMLVFAAVLAVIVLAAVLVLVLVSRHNRAPKDDPAALATPTAQITEQDTVLAEAKHLAAQYDYDKAIAAVTGFAGWENAPELQQAKADFEAQKAQAVRWADPTTIPHVFFHTLIADTARAFDGDPEQGGYNQFMTTIKEFNAVLQSLYERGYVLVDIHDVAGPQQQADGSTKYVAGDIYLPAGKTPIVMSQDDVCYYEYMTDSDGDGRPDKGGDAQKWNDQIAAVIGETDVLLYPFGSDIAGIEAYKGAKFDTLYGLGFRYFCNVDSAKHWVQIHDGYVRQGRRNIDGYRMYYQPNLLDDLFDTRTVWDDARPTPVPKI